MRELLLRRPTYSHAKEVAMRLRHSFDKARRWFRGGPKASRARRSRRLAIEVLEDRSVPTVLVSPFFGAEAQSQDGPAKLSSPQVFLTYWGSYWGGTSTAQAGTIRNAASAVLGSSFLSGVRQYGSDGQASLAPLAGYDSSVPPPGFSQGALSAVVHNQIHHGPLPEPDGPPHTPIYVVVTPPGALSALKNDIGYNTNDQDLDGGPLAGDVDNIPEVWVSTSLTNPNDPTSLNLDQFTLTLSHELAEVMSDFGSGGVEASAPAAWVAAGGGGDNQIGDREGNSYAYRLGGGVDVQPIWSRADHAWLVADGNSQTVHLAAAPKAWDTSHPAAGPVFNGKYDITINGGQLAAGPNDTFQVSEATLAGHDMVQVRLNGELFQFDTASVNSLTINTGAGSDVVNVTTAPAIPITINGNPNTVVSVGSPAGPTATAITVNTAGSVTVGSTQATVSGAVTVNNAASVNVGGGRADLVSGAVTLHSPQALTALTVDDSQAPSFATWSVDARSVSLGKPSISFDAGRLRSLRLLGGAGGSQMNLGSALTPLESLPSNITVTGGGGVSLLTVSGRASAANDYRVTNQLVSSYQDLPAGTQIANNLLNQVHYANLTGLEVDGSLTSADSFHVLSTAAATPVTLLGGHGADSFTAGDAADSLDGLLAPVKLTGNGSASLTLDDEATAAARSENLDTGALTRSTTDGARQFTPVYFRGMGHVALDGAAGGGGIGVFGVAAGTSVDVYGHAGVQNVFVVYPHYPSTGALLGTVNVHGQSADNDFAIYYDNLAPGPNSYTLRTDPTGTTEEVTRSGAGLATYSGVAKVLLYTPLVGGSTLNVQGVLNSGYVSVAAQGGDSVVLGSQAQGLGGTLAGLHGPVVVTAPASAVVSLTVDDSGDTTAGNKLVTLSPVGNGAYGAHIDGLAPSTVYYNLSPASNVTIRGGSANELFVARGVLGSGALTIQAGDGRDVLIAGANPITLLDGGGQDILIAGSTAYDNNAAALRAILNEWSRTDETFATRVGNLTGGVNGLPALNAGTVRWNHGGSRLIGTSGLDWFFAHSFAEVFGFSHADAFTPIWQRAQLLSSAQSRGLR
jgi:hypothetical protein